jgi:RNA polymerase sigma-70 factor (ECF subfamily)
MDDVVRRAVAGDPDAFTELVRSTRPRVRKVIAAHVHRSDDVDDLVQEAFLKAYRAIGSLDEPASILHWLDAIARNVARDHLRRLKRDKVDDRVETDDSVVDPDPGPEDLAEVRELSAALKIGLSRLSARDATLLAMVTSLGFTPTDVAATLGMSNTAAKVAVHRARQRLRNVVLLQDELSPAAMRCPDLIDLSSRGDVVEAAIHARACELCSAR